MLTYALLINKACTSHKTWEKMYIGAWTIFDEIEFNGKRPLCVRRMGFFVPVNQMFGM